MAVDKAVLQQVVDTLSKSQKILITPSSPADGDSLGAALALYLVLRKLGKEPTVVMSDNVPEAYEFLPNTNEIHHELAGMKDFVITLDCKDAEVDTIKYQVEDDKVNIIVSPKSGKFMKESVVFKNGADQFDVIVSVDAGDVHQMRDLYEENKALFETMPLINIDHHASNSKFGTINCVDLDCSSTTQVLMPIIDALNTTGSEIIDADIATLLLAGLITDTGSFQHANTTPQAFEVASRLLDLGAQQQQIIKSVYKTKSLSTLKLWGRVLSKIQYEDDFKLVWSTITNQDLLDTNSTTDESNGIIDELMTNAPGAELILLIKQKADDLVSVSVRTNSDDVDGSAFAKQFGGGGHIRAAGFRVKGKGIQDAEKEIVEAAMKFQADRLKLHENAPAAGVIEAEKIDATPQKVKSEEVVEKLTRDFFEKEEGQAVPVASATPTVPVAPQAPVPPVAPQVPVPPVPAAPAAPATPVVPVEQAKSPEQQAAEVAKLVSQTPAPVPVTPQAPAPPVPQIPQVPPTPPTSQEPPTMPPTPPMPQMPPNTPIV